MKSCMPSTHACDLHIIIIIYYALCSKYYILKTAHYYYNADTTRPNVTLTRSASDSLLISWSATSPQDMTLYIVFWMFGTAPISRSDTVSGTMYTIDGLLSNTAYHVMVQAIGQLASINSSIKVFYTTPKAIDMGKFTLNHLHS